MRLFFSSTPIEMHVYKKQLGCQDSVDLIEYITEKNMPYECRAYYRGMKKSETELAIDVEGFFVAVAPLYSDAGFVTT